MAGIIAYLAVQLIMRTHGVRDAWAWSQRCLYMESGVSCHGIRNALACNWGCLGKELGQHMEKIIL